MLSTQFTFAVAALALAILGTSGIAGASARNAASTTTTTPTPPEGVKVQQNDQLILTCDIDCAHVLITSGHLEDCVLVCKTTLPERGGLGRNSNIFIIRENTVPNASIIFSHAAA